MGALKSGYAKDDPFPLNRNKDDAKPNVSSNF
jgi:hypothetical protein